MKRMVRLTESDLRSIVKESVKIILEGASKKLYHYCGVSNLKAMLKNDSFLFYGGDDKVDGYYGFSTTRQRNSKTGFAPMLRRNDGGLKNTMKMRPFFIRLELDGEAVQNLQYDYRNKHYGVKVRPLDFKWYENDGETPRLNGKEQELKDIADDWDDEFNQEQWTSQAEDRILSKKKSVGGLRKCLKRIDVCVFIDEIEYLDYEEFRESYYELIYLSQLQEDEGIQVYFYTNQDAFNIQANKTVTSNELMDKLREIGRANGYR